MNPYVILTDSACDIPPEILEQWGVTCRELTFRFEGDENEYSNNDMSQPEFYSKMRAGGIAKTAAVNTEVFTQMFEVPLKEGKDVLYLGFSSGLSTTYNSGRLAIEQLRSKYPERTILAVDSLSASAGFGLLIYLTVQKQKEGAAIEEVANYAEGLKYRLCHWFTVDDLVYLKRGGRISPTVALVGNLLGIKPVLHMDNEGHLINMFKVRGRKTSVAALADKYGELALDKENGTVFISHGDCLEDAKELEKILKDRYNAKVELIVYVGTVIGAHSGPGTLALFFEGKER